MVDLSVARSLQGFPPMTVHLSLVVVLTLVVWLLIRRGGLKFGHAVAAILLGFYLHGSSLAPSISRLVQNAVDVISEVRL
jgi:hypothetical protein